MCSKGTVFPCEFEFEFHQGQSDERFCSHRINTPINVGYTRSTRLGHFSVIFAVAVLAFLALAAACFGFALAFAFAFFRFARGRVGVSLETFRNKSNSIHTPRSLELSTHCQNRRRSCPRRLCAFGSFACEPELVAAYLLLRTSAQGHRAAGEW